MTPNWRSTLQGQITLYMCKLCLRFPKFTPFHCTTSPYRDTGHFETSALNGTQIDLEPCKVKVPYICITSIPDSQISLRFALWPGVFEIQAILSAPNDSKMTLITTRSYVPHIYATSIHESQISLHFAPRRSIFEIKAMLRQVHRMTSNWPWTLQGQISLYVYNNCPWVSDFIPFRPMTSLFRVTGQFWDKCTAWPKMTLNTTRSKVHHIHVTNVPESQISLRFALRSALFKISHIL